MKIDIIAGARPNFVKIASIIEEIEKARSAGYKIEYRLIHTGQHSENIMSDCFFDQLDIPAPDINLGAQGESQAEITAKIMLGYEKIINDKSPELCMVVGDVTSTMACALVAQKAGIPVAHVEGGLRSNDWSMHEEINRLVTDSITNIFFTTSEFANKNLALSGVRNDRVFFVGNTMIDTLLKYQGKLIRPKIFEKAELKEKEYFVLTMHRPANVDSPDVISSFLSEISLNSRDFPVIFPVHPRTQKALISGCKKYKNIIFTLPMSYLEFIFLLKNSKAVITDSGGITEESTVLGIPCMTLRDNTERPETCLLGTNELIGTDPANIAPAFKKLFGNKWKKGKIPPFWDGHAAQRIVDALIKEYNLNL
jgi:UDP-N-acetylglucosamine 2-epimerase (non-hydrolysing)